MGKWPGIRDLRESILDYPRTLAAVALVLALVVGYLVGDHYTVDIHAKKSGSDPVSLPPKQPVEFLYLNSADILRYVSQLEGGKGGAVRKVSNEIETAKGEVSAGGLGLGATHQEENQVESTLAPTAWSEMWILLKDLHEKKIDIDDVTLGELRKGDEFKEGSLVRFSTRKLLSPGYIRPYAVLRQAATLEALFPRVAGRRNSERRAKRQRERARAFAKQIGPNPRITFAVTSRPKNKREEAVKVLMPMQYAGLTNERSMLEKGHGRFTGGRLTVIGKVLRVFRGKGRSAGVWSSCPAASPSCQKRLTAGKPAYTDFATRETWRAPIEQATNYLINTVSHTCRATWGDSEAHPKNKRRMRGRHCFLTRLKRQTQLQAPGALILPLAIYK